jgi:hypothetical protein
MAAFVKFFAFVEHLAEGVHNLQTNSLKVYLTNTAPNQTTHALKADLAEISTGNGYTAGGLAVTVTSSAQTSGTYKLISTSNPQFAASGGSIGPFRYVVLWNDTPASPLDPLIGYWDYGAAVTLADGETFTVDFDDVNGILQIA